MIGSLVAGFVGGALASGCGTIEKKVVHNHYHSKNNELIEYHKWIEEREAKKKFESDEYDRTHCLACGKKIEVKKSHCESFDGVKVKLTLSCGCGRFTEFGKLQYSCLYEDEFNTMREMYKKAHDALKRHESEVLASKL